MTDPDSILQLGIEAAKEGNNRDARELFRLLVREDPRNSRGWLWLAGVAETNDERRNALEQVYALDPSNELAREGLRAMGIDVSQLAAAPAPSASPATTIALESPSAPAADRYAGIDDDDPFAQLDSLSDVFEQDPGAVRRADADGDTAASAAVAASTAAAAATRGADSGSRPRTLNIGLGKGKKGDTASSSTGQSASSRKAPAASSRAESKPARSNALSGSRKNAPDKSNNDIRKHKYYPLLLGLTVLLVACGLFAMLDGPSRIAALFGGGPSNQVVQVPPPTQPSPQVLPTAPGVLPAQPGQPVQPEQPQPPQLAVDPAIANPGLVDPNTVLESNGWFYNFPTSIYASPLPSPLGGLQARGQFALVLTFVSNGTGQDQPIPPDFFVLKDAQGRVYFPSVEASAAYRASGGVADVNYGDIIPSDGVTRSVPVVFDVAPDASGLVFFAPSNAAQGWLVLPDVR